LEGQHDFEVTLDGNQSGKSTWIYSSNLGKVFVKMNAKITFDVSFKPMNMPPQSMFLRVIPVYSDPAELGHPVTRCANHKSNERPFVQDGIGNCFLCKFSGQSYDLLVLFLQKPIFRRIFCDPTC
jgi:P53 DNA-binding domain